MYDLSVITVCKNAMSTLPRCIECVQPLYATSLKVEYLIIDGESTDGTLEYLQDQLNKGRITTFISEPDEGLYDAMNKAIHLARGQVIVFINSDDEICPDSVARCCEPILKGVADAVAAAAEVVTSSGKIASLRYPDLDKSMLMSVCCHQSYYCRTETLRSLNGFNWRKFPIIADAELMGRMYIKKRPTIALNCIASRFYVGGISSGNLTKDENIRLLVHFKQHIVQEAIKPKFANALFIQISKYLIRYVAHAPDVKMATRDALNYLSPLIREVISVIPKYTHTQIHRRFLWRKLIYKFLGNLGINKKFKIKSYVNSEMHKLFC